MIPREWWDDRRFRIVAGVLLLALLCLGWTVANAWRIPTVAATPAAVNVMAGALDTPVAPAPIDLSAMGAAALFSPGRAAAPDRYRMPGEGVAAGPAPDAPRPVVLGTAIAADGSSFATCQFQSSRLLMVRVGDHVGEYLVKAIERGRVVFVSPAGKSLEVLALRPES
ncbi:MAG TPA: hypothetical protein VHW65_09060 [Gemmatimonadales bacterium]|nr:hypothetical protein [Gemmatimonadales bacterium]